MNKNLTTPITPTASKATTMATVATSVFVAMSLTACQQSAEQSYGNIAGETMGTSYHISYQLPEGANEQSVQAIQASIDKRLAQINNSMSTWQEDSTISQFNQTGAHSPMLVDADFIQVFIDSKMVYEQSGGAFDPTVKPIFELWGFGKEMRVDRLQSPPTADEIAKAKALIDFDSVQLDGDKLSKNKAGVAIDFSAIAKGYGVDVIAEVLQGDYQITNYMVEIGGEVVTSGVNDKGVGWKIAIDAPILHSGVTDRETIAMIQQATDDTNSGSMHLATSGNYRNSIVFDGVRYSHTIDPHAGTPVVGGAPSVTVASDSVAIADAWATALTAMPYEQALTMAEDKGLAALFIVPKDGVDVNQDSHNLEDWQVVETTAMKALRAGAGK